MVATQKAPGAFRTLGIPSFNEGGSDSDGGEDSDGTKDTLAASEITLHPSCSGMGVNLEQAFGLEIETDENAGRLSVSPKKGPASYFPPLLEGDEGRGTSATPSISNQDEEMDSDGNPSPQFGSWFTRAFKRRQQSADEDEVEVEPSVTVSKSDWECEVDLPPLETVKELEMFQAFRAGFGPGNTLVVRTETQPGHFTGWRFLSVGNSGAPRDFLREKVRQTLGICHEFSDPIEELQEGGGPCPNRREVSCGRSLLEKVAAAIARVNFELREVYADGLSEEECNKLEHGVETWLLVSTLFGRLSDVVEADPETHLMERRARITSWIRQSTAKSVEDGLRSISRIDMEDEEEPVENKEEADYFGALGLLLSGGHTAAAACLAASKGDARLATWLATAGTSQAQADCIKDYLALIDSTSNSEDYLSPRSRAVYELLAGNLEWLETGFFLDWRRMLGSYMWYVCPETAPIHEVLATYEKERATYEEQTDNVNRPWPHYYDRGEQGGSYDTQYKLLQLYGTLERDASLDEGQLGELLDTSGYSENPMDVLNSWMLLGVLLSAGAITEEDLKSCNQIFNLHMTMISVCESLELPEWAVFVASHMPVTNGERTKIIKEILKRMAPLLEASHSGPAFMSDELGVPVEWIHEALAGWYYYKGDRRNQFIQLLKAEHYVRAHDVFCRHVGPIAFESQDNQLGTFVQTMERAPVEIPMWTHGGAIYLEFERILGEYGQSPRQEIEEHILQFKAAVREAETHWAACTPTKESRIQMYCFFRSMVEKLVKEIRRFNISELPSSQVLF